MRRVGVLFAVLGVFFACASLARETRRLPYEVVNHNWMQAEVVFTCDSGIVVKRIRVETGETRKGSINDYGCTSHLFFVRLLSEPASGYMSTPYVGWTPDRTLRIRIENHLPLTTGVVRES